MTFTPGGLWHNSCFGLICIDSLQKDPAELSKEMIYNFERDPPPIEWHIIDPEKDTEAAWKEWNNCSDSDDPLCVGWKLLIVRAIFKSRILKQIFRNWQVEFFEFFQLHPVEIARQLTLIEYSMYKAVRSSELIGAAWTKDHRDEVAPNVTKIMRSTTNVGNKKKTFFFGNYF